MAIIAQTVDLRNYVQVFQNLLHKDTCNEVIKWAEQQPEATSAWDGWEIAKAAISNTENKVTDHRTCHFTMMNEHRGPCVKNLQTALLHVQKHYPYRHGTTEHTGLQIMRYQVGHKFKEHIDHYGGAARILSVSILLNDDFEGGEFALWNRTYKPLLQQGDAVVFPSNLCFPHEVIPVTQGIRYALVVWML